MGTLAEDFAAYLLAQGQVDYLLGTDASGDLWGVGIYYMPPRPDRVVLVTEYAGGPPANVRTAVLEYPGLQIRVRAPAHQSSEATSKITAIARFLDDASRAPLTIDGTEYRAIISQQSAPLFMGLDDQDDRPEFTWNFEVWRSR